MSPWALVSQSHTYFIPKLVGRYLRSNYVPKVSISHRINQLAYRKRRRGIEASNYLEAESIGFIYIYIYIYIYTYVSYENRYLAGPWF